MLKAQAILSWGASVGAGVLGWVVVWWYGGMGVCVWYGVGGGGGGGGGGNGNRARDAEL